jgi:hypothetical protein
MEFLCYTVNEILGSLCATGSQRRVERVEELVRNLRPLQLEPRERFNVFSGDNGQGKTGRPGLRAAA